MTVLVMLWFATPSPSAAAWNADHSAIITERRVVGPDGVTTVEQVRGGCVDGVCMVVHHAPGPAQAVQTKTTTGSGLHWGVESVPITYHPDGTSHIGADTEFDIMDGVFETWERSFEDCSYLRFDLGERVAGEVSTLR